MDENEEGERIALAARYSSSRICRFGVNVAESSAAILRTKRKTSYLADVSSRLLIGKKSGRLLPPLAAVFPAPFLASPRCPRYHREKAPGSAAGDWKSELIKAIKLISTSNFTRPLPNQARFNYFYRLGEPYCVRRLYTSRSVNLTAYQKRCR